MNDLNRILQSKISPQFFTNKHNFFAQHYTYIISEQIMCCKYYEMYLLEQNVFNVIYSSRSFLHRCSCRVSIYYFIKS